VKRDLRGRASGNSTRRDPDDTWNCIRVFRGLNVGPVHIERQRVLIPYTRTTDEGALTRNRAWGLGSPPCKTVPSSSLPALTPDRGRRGGVVVEWGLLLAAKDRDRGQR